MHMGRTEGADCTRPMLRSGARGDGAISPDGRIMGCYIHGLFVEDAFRRAYLNTLNGDVSSRLNYEAGVQAALDDLAEAIEAHLDVDGLIAASAAIG
jgi:adenosylcobyric acid synthase